MSSTLRNNIDPSAPVITKIVASVFASIVSAFFIYYADRALYAAGSPVYGFPLANPAQNLIMTALFLPVILWLGLRPLIYASLGGVVSCATLVAVLFLFYFFAGVPFEVETIAKTWIYLLCLYAVAAALFRLFVKNHRRISG